MSLARIRQLSAHEVGHTLGFEHNFAASTQDRASVMDYPAPLVRITADGDLDLSEAYDVGIGEWDKRTVLYAYQDFPDGVDRAQGRLDILHETFRQGFKYVADMDSRSVSTSHPDGNLWDNGADAIAELEHLLRVREIALQRFSERNIRIGRPLATIEETLVPIYLLHRFQIQAVGKLIGGQYFNYRLRADAQADARPVAVARQQQAIDALLATLDPAVLRLPQSLVDAITPRVPNNPKSRETFAGATGMNFDALAPARSSVALDPAGSARPEQGRTTRTRRIDRFRCHRPGPAQRELVCRTRRAGSRRRFSGRRTCRSCTGCWVWHSMKAPTATCELAHTRSVAELQEWLSRTQFARSCIARPFPFRANTRSGACMDDPDAIEKLMVPATVPPGSPIG